MKLVLEGRMEGKRPRGRPRIGMIDDVLDETYGDMKRKAENRELESLVAKDLPLGRELMMIYMIFIYINISFRSIFSISSFEANMLQKNVESTLDY